MPSFGQIALTHVEPETPKVGLRLGVFDLKDGADGLLFEPLPRVALVDACGIGKLGGCRRGTVRKRLVETHALAYVDAKHLCCSQHAT